jgi:hypothetical protein
VTIVFGRPFKFDVIRETTREQQQQAADYIFERIKELHGELQRVGHRGAHRLAAARAGEA